MNVFAALLDLFLPRECHVCECRLSNHEEFVCEDCMRKLPLTGYEKYWTNKTAPNSDLNPMEQRFAGQVLLKHACAPFFYARESVLASLVHDFKYRNYSRMATVLGEYGASTLLPSGFFDGVDILIPVPLHWTKRLKRGYNQSEMIAKGVSRATDIPVGMQLIARKPHRTQTSLSVDRRIANTSNIFSLKNPDSLAGKNIMLVDDICTTGATLLSAANTIIDVFGRDTRLSFFTLGVV